MGGRAGLFYSDKFLDYDLGPAHPLRPVRVKLTHDLIEAEGLLENNLVKRASPRAATQEEILLFHEPEYVSLVKKYSEKGSGLLDSGDTPAFKGCFEATSLVVGTSVKACDNIMTGKLTHAFNPSGGLHHAHPERASGFCIFNDPAVSIAYLKKKHQVKRLLYLDVDAHHGDGVMYGFYDDPTVLDIDFHENGRYIFPGTGFPDEIGEGKAEGLKINVPVPPGTGDEAYLNAFHRIVPKVVRRFKPEIILVQCGADAHADDRLAHLRLTTNTYHEVVSEAHSLAHELCGGRLLLFGGGGYTLANVPRVWTTAFAAMTEVIPEDEIPEDWQTEFHRVSKQEAPTRLRNVPTKDDSKTKDEIGAVLDQLSSYIPN